MRLEWGCASGGWSCGLRRSAMRRMRVFCMVRRLVVWAVFAPGSRMRCSEGCARPGRGMAARRAAHELVINFARWPKAVMSRRQPDICIGGGRGHAVIASSLGGPRTSHCRSARGRAQEVAKTGRGSPDTSAARAEARGRVDVLRLDRQARLHDGLTGPRICVTGTAMSRQQSRLALESSVQWKLAAGGVVDAVGQHSGRGLPPFV